MRRRDPARSRASGGACGSGRRLTSCVARQAVGGARTQRSGSAERQVTAGQPGAGPIRRPGLGARLGFMAHRTRWGAGESESRAGSSPAAGSVSRGVRGYGRQLPDVVESGLLLRNPRRPASDMGPSPRRTSAVGRPVRWEVGPCDDRGQRPGNRRSSRGRSQMKDDEIRSRFDGRGRVVLLPGHASAPRQRRIEEIARALGYRLLTTESLGSAGVRLVYERDDGPLARRRTELTIARLRAGGPLLPAMEPPPPPPPGPPPTAPAQRRTRQPVRPPSEPPPTPAAAPAGPRVPPPPPYPPLPPSATPNALRRRSPPRDSASWPGGPADRAWALKGAAETSRTWSNPSRRGSDTSSAWW
ncbi:hypothetical protein JOC24_002829 [Streptomyces sp. HB132]|nr:hypothetical protein [Streptomyces sp. HB132]